MVRAVAYGVKGSEFNSQHGHGVFFFFLSLSWLIRKTQLSPLEPASYALIQTTKDYLYQVPVTHITNTHCRGTHSTRCTGIRSTRCTGTRINRCTSTRYRMTGTRDDEYL